jgi:hypothetical protein
VEVEDKGEKRALTRNYMQVNKKKDQSQIYVLGP